MITHVLFDADGVTILGRHKYFSQRFSEEYNVPLDDIIPFFKKEFGKCTTGKADIKDVLPSYLTTWGWKGSVDEFLEYWFSGENEKNEKVLDIIDKLRLSGIKCYLATNQEKHRARYIADNIGLAAHLDGCFFSCDLGYKKEDPRFFQEVIEKLNASTDKVMYWDDDQEDVDVAKAEGIDARIYKDFEDFEKHMKGIIA